MNRKMNAKLTNEIEKESPSFAKYAKQILFDEVWQDETLTSKERSLITLSVLATLGNTEQLTYHIENAYKNGVKKEEMISLSTHLSLYIGWPLSVQLLNRILNFKK